MPRFAVPCDTVTTTPFLVELPRFANRSQLEHSSGLSAQNFKHRHPILNDLS